ncbi:MAG: glucuronate isomerase, partial [Chloroflexi bacterium]
MTHEALTSREYRYFDPNPAQRTLAAQLYDTVADLPLICPHGHVDPRLFADANYRFGTPVDLLIVPDHYIFRMLYSKGIALQDLGIPTQDGTPVQENHRTIWQLVADHWHLFRGTPTDIWIRDELERVFGITEKLNSQNALAIYDQIERQLQAAHFTPRTLYTQFNIEILATTNAATDTLSHHQTIQRSWWTGKVIPTFRPDAVVNIHDDHWRDEINRLSQVSGVTVRDYPTYIQALEQRRTFFKSLG